MPADWGEFNRRLVCEPFWLNRKVEHQRYQGDNFWSRRVSLDIDQECLSRLLEDCLLEESESIENDYDACYCCLPIGTLGKRHLLKEFSLTDAFDVPISLCSEEECIEQSYQALCGAVAFEAKVRKDSTFGKKEANNPIHAKQELGTFLRYQWIGNRVLPRPKNGKQADELELDEIFDIANLCIDLCAHDDDSWLRVRSTLRKQLAHYYKNSLMFRYFLRFFYLSSILWAYVDVVGETSSIMKMEYAVQSDVFDPDRWPSRREGRSSHSWLRYDAEIAFDGIPFAGNYHLELSAPDGSNFYPRKKRFWDRYEDRMRVKYFPPRFSPEEAERHRRWSKEDWYRKARAHRERFDEEGIYKGKWVPYCIRYRAIDYAGGKSSIPRARTDMASFNCDEAGNYVSIDPHGTYTPGSLSIWSGPFDSPSHDPETFFELPTLGNTCVHDYHLVFSISPALTMRHIVQVAIVLISLVYLLLSGFFAFFTPEGAKGISGFVASVAGVIIPFVTLSFTLAQNRTTQPHLLYRVPWICSVVSAGVDLVFAMLFIYAGNAKETSSEQANAALEWFLLFGLIVVLVCAICTIVWLSHVRIRKAVRCEEAKSIHDVPLTDDPVA